MLTAPALLPSGSIVTSYVNVANAGTASQAGQVAIKTVDPVSGAVLRPELVVSTSNSTFITGASTAALADYGLSPGGGHVVVWRDVVPGFAGQSVVGRIYDRLGNAFGSIFRISSTEGGGEDPVVTSLPNRNFVVAWSYGGIKAQLFSLDGTKIGSEIKVHVDSPGGKIQPSITALSNNGFVVAWEDRGPGTTVGPTSDVKAQIFDANGAKVGSEYVVSSQSDDWQMQAAVASLKDGGFVVAWSSFSQSPLVGWSVKAQLFTNTGVKIGTEFRVNTKVVNYQIAPSAAALSGGGFVITWLDSNNGYTPTDDYIRGQVYSSVGDKVGAEFVISQTPLLLKTGTKVVALPADGFFVTWTEFSGTLSDPATTVTYKGRAYT